MLQYAMIFTLITFYIWEKKVACYLIFVQGSGWLKVYKTLQKVLWPFNTK